MPWCRRASRAHPRSRGENIQEVLSTPIMTGSSPLTRGKLRPGRAARAQRGLIPAHAGKTDFGVASIMLDRAHPRSRGENTDASMRIDTVFGSSPLTRGKRRRRSRPSIRDGLIPAHAGKTCSHDGRARRHAAHPRSRGENTITEDLPVSGQGSSPLTRGKRSGSAAGAANARLIPAHAGKTFPAGLIGGARRAHPRSRGENGESPCVARSKTGSSPLTRGKRRRSARDRRGVGLIPAHAGKT